MPETPSGDLPIIREAIQVQEEYIQFQKLDEGLKAAEDAARMIGKKRLDERWIWISKAIYQMRMKALVLGRKRLM